MLGRLLNEVYKHYASGGGRPGNPNPATLPSFMARLDDGSTPMLPTSAKLYGRALVGDTAPITAEDFTPAELDVLAHRIGVLGAGPVHGSDVWKHDREHPIQQYSALGEALLGLIGREGLPEREIDVTLGQYNVVDAPGGYNVMDRYNFNAIAPTRRGSFRRAINSLLGTRGEEQNTYDALRALGEALGPRGELFGGDDSAGLPVEVFIPQERVDAQRRY